MGIHLTKIYTKSGDKGFTSVPGGMTVEKDGIICDVMGEIDELNSHIGLLRTWYENANRHILESSDFVSGIYNLFKNIQNNLFDIGCIVSMVYSTNPPVIDESQVEELEKTLDILNERLSPLNSFVLPGGSETSSQAHIARSVCRRVERRLVEFSKIYTIDSVVLRYINRLSDYLFVYARWSLKKEKGTEYLWTTPLKMNAK